MLAESPMDLRVRLAASAFGAREMFSSNYGLPPSTNEQSQAVKVALKVRAEYAEVRDLPVPASKPRGANGNDQGVKGALGKGGKQTTRSAAIVEDGTDDRAEGTEEKTSITSSTASSTLSAASSIENLIAKFPNRPSDSAPSSLSSALVSYNPSNSAADPTTSSSSSGAFPTDPNSMRALSTDLILKQRRRKQKQPEWHAPWKLKRVIAGHQGWVRCIAIDPSNEWFATGSGDHTIKIWDLASGVLKVTLTGHISPVRGLDISTRSPYMFSVSEDRTVKCWDLESNSVIRSYHGHVNGVTAVRCHPELDLVMSGGRDGTVRVWDVRTKVCVRMLTGHKAAIGRIDAQGCEPQIISGSHDATIRLWDLVAGKTITQLTHHKKSVRSVLIHPEENSFVSCSTDGIKMWKLPEGVFMRPGLGHHGVANALALNRGGSVLACGLDNGLLSLYDWATGHCFQQISTPPQSGSLDSENGIFGVEFDKTGSRMFTVEADKTIKMYAEDPNATPETHPVVFDPHAHSKGY